MLMSEDNSSEVADHIANWVAVTLPAGQGVTARPIVISPRQGD
jgi:hypothetical protein